MNLLEQFGLDHDQALLMFSMQRYLVVKDIEGEKLKMNQIRKMEWLDQWVSGIEDLLSQSKKQVELLRNKQAIIEKANKVKMKCKNVKIPLYLILLELSLFTPYFALEGFKPKLFEKLKINGKIEREHLKEMAYLLGVNGEIIERYKGSFQRSVKSLSNFHTKLLVGAGLGAVLIAITAGLATPYLASLAAPAGLAGAAAVNAGLAALGGGAIAAGGLGMAGGISVIVGGGSIFGALGGGALGAILSNSSDFALREGAKLEVIMKEVILVTQKDLRFAQEMIKGQQAVIKKLEEELAEMKFNEAVNKKRIQNLSKAIKYLRSSLHNSEKAFNESDRGVYGDG